ncbi:MAG TPA: protein BatD [Sulfurivirga caldicuralii]|nr:protein BatD [Sulfurivirga caldicuralii]
MVRTLSTLSLMLAVISAHAASLETHIDRHQVEMGDILTLTLTLKGMDVAQPAPKADFTPLEKHFHILGQQRNTQLMMNNGQVNKFEQWQVQLAPRHPGRITLPAITLGAYQSEPIAIEVKPAPSQLERAPEFFIYNQVDTPQPYVQQQVHYQVRLYYQGELINGAMAPPALADAQIMRLDEQNIFHKQLNGTRYTVFEWNYALFPQRSGRLTLSPQGFSGQLYLKQKLKQISGKTPPITLQVKPIPATWPNGYDWLPSTRVTLTARWNGPQQPKTGDSFTLTLTLTAAGVRGEQLPQIKLPQLPGVRIYTEPETSNTQRSATGLTGSKTYRWTLLLTQPGPLSLPSIRIPWWDVHHDRLRWQATTAKTLEVAGSETSSSLEAISATTTDARQTTQPLWPWQLATALLALVSLILAFWLWRVKHRPEPRTNPPAAGKNLRQSDDLCQMPLAAFYQALLKHPAATDQILLFLRQQLQTALFHDEDLHQAEQIRQRLCRQLKKSAGLNKMDPTAKEKKKLKSIYP